MGNNYITYVHLSLWGNSPCSGPNKKQEPRRVSPSHQLVEIKVSPTWGFWQRPPEGRTKAPSQLDQLPAANTQQAAKKYLPLGGAANGINKYHLGIFFCTTQETCDAWEMVYYLFVVSQSSVCQPITCASQQLWHVSTVILIAVLELLAISPRLRRLESLKYTIYKWCSH